MANTKRQSRQSTAEAASRRAGSVLDDASTAASNTPAHDGPAASIIGVRVASPEDTVQQAAQIMHEEDTGVLPVGENDRLVSMVTDHDIATLVDAARDPAHTKVREAMAPDARYVFEDEDPQEAAANMAERHLMRLPVLSRAKRLVGVVSLDDLAAEGRIPSGAVPVPGRRPPNGAHSGMPGE